MYGGLVAKSCRSLLSPWTVALCNQSPLSMRFPRQEYWSELPFPSPGNLPDLGIKPASPALQADSLLLSHQGSLLNHHIVYLKYMQFLFVNYTSVKLKKVSIIQQTPVEQTPQLYQLLPLAPCILLLCLHTYTHTHTRIHMHKCTRVFLLLLVLSLLINLEIHYSYHSSVFLKMSTSSSEK